MGIDYGDARTGIAVCDKFEKLAFPVCVIKQWNEDKLIDQIKEKIAEYKPERLIVGLPKNMDSSEGERAQKCCSFAEKLSFITGIPFEMCDERLTTVEAHQFLSANDVRGKKRKETVDQVAAVIILQDYLNKKKNISED